MPNRTIKQEIFSSHDDALSTLAAAFPEVMKDGEVDWDALKAIFKDAPFAGLERYELTWAGKAEAKREAGRDVVGRTLRFCQEESKDAETTQNLYIEGDNLEVLKLLRENYYGAVKMIYIDPPYNTGNDFVYRDKFAQSEAESELAEGNIDEEGRRLVKNPKSLNRYHANWLSMMYPRLRCARDLLTIDGAIFISIDDNEVHNLRKLCDEIFGDGNFAGLIPWRKRTAKSDVPFGISQDYEWIVCYARSEEFVACVEGGTRKYYSTEDLPGRPWRIHDLTTQRSATERPNSDFTMVNPRTGEKYPVNKQRTWAVTTDTFNQYYSENRIVFPGDYDFLNISRPAFRYFKEDDIKKAGDKFGFISVSTNLPDDIGMTEDGTKEITSLFGQKIFGYPKPTELLKFLIKITTSAGNDDSPIILDFFSGSASTAHAVMQLNLEDGKQRRFIMVQIPEACEPETDAHKNGFTSITEIGKKRIRMSGEIVKKASLSSDDATVDSLFKTEQHLAVARKLDIGFKVFKSADTTLQWTFNALRSGDQMTLDEAAMSDKDRLDFMPGFTDIDVVYEIALRQNDIPLSAPVRPVPEAGKRTYLFADSILVCLEESITPELVEALAALQPTPNKFVLRDSAFEDNIVLKDETLRRLQACVARNTKDAKPTYVVDFI